MSLLLPQEYDVRYFDPWKADYAHVAGYSRYEKWRRVHDAFTTHQESTGEYFSDMMKMYRVQQFLDGKKVLDVGCAKGFMVEALRDMGVNAWGVDCSAYAIGEAREDIRPFLIQADAREYLPALKKNSFNVIYSRWFLTCMSDADLTVVIPAMNNAGFLQIHHIWTDFLPEHYNCHPMEWWLSGAGFKRGTRLIYKDDIANPFTVK